MANRVYDYVCTTCFANYGSVKGRVMHEDYYRARGEKHDTWFLNVTVGEAREMAAYPPVTEEELRAVRQSLGVEEDK